MVEITKIYLENEMDLILAQQRSMKLAEFTGLSLSAQTSFGTAVSEVCRFVLDKKYTVTLLLGLQDNKENFTLVAKIAHNKDNISNSDEAILYATRLVGRVYLSSAKVVNIVTLEQKLHNRQKFAITQFDEWRNFFRNEVPLSPYEELKQKNIRLKELTEKLAQSELQYKTLAESLPLLIFTTDEKGELEYVNTWMKNFTGQEMNDVKTSQWRSIVHNEDITPLSANGKNGVHTGSQLPISEFRIKNRDGNYVWHVGAAVPLYDEFKNVKNRIGYFADINAQKVAEQTLKDNKELKEAQERLAQYQAALEQRIVELNQSNLELAQFAYVASHDLQEPLRKLMVYNDYIQQKFKGGVNDDIKAIMGRMTESCARMRLLILDLLSFSQIRKEALKFENISINKVVDNVRENLDRIVAEKQACITVDELPAIEASERHINQLFENLITNSLKYAKEGVPPKINISFVATTAENIVIRISDNGIGFENQYADKIFGLFQRLHNKDEYEGTGIGLALCKKITDLHNGTITASGQPEEGATFTVTLPIAQLK